MRLLWLAALAGCAGSGLSDDPAGVVRPEVSELREGWTELSGDAGEWQFFQVDVPAGMDALHVATSGGWGDPDLYVRHWEEPTEYAADCTSTNAGTDEACEIALPGGGPWVIGIYAYSDYGDLALDWWLDEGAVGGLGSLRVDDLDLAAGALDSWTFELPYEAREAVVTTSGGWGDLRLRVTQGGAEVCLAEGWGTEWSCTVDWPWWGTPLEIEVHALSDVSDVTLEATASFGHGPG